MPRIHETAYPRLKSVVTEAELHEIHAPTAEEIAFAEARTYSETARVGLLVLLKTFQRLGYFVTLAAVPRQIIAYITACAGLSAIPKGIWQRFVLFRAIFSWQTDGNGDAKLSKKLLGLIFMDVHPQKFRV